MTNRRRPADVYGEGEEPDPRFSLANERTALAWMRTALAIVAGGVALVSLSSVTSMPTWTPLVGAAACVGGGATALRSVFGWRRVERALRQRRPLPAPHALLPLAVGVGLLSLVMVGLSLVEVARR